MNTLLVFENERRAKILPYIKDVFAEHIAVDYYGTVIDTRKEYSKAKDLKHFIPLDLIDFSIPKESYQIDSRKTAKVSKAGIINAKTTKEVIFVCSRTLDDNGFEDILAARYYLQETGYPLEKCKCMMMGYLTRWDIENGLRNIKDFSEVYEYTLKRIADQEQWNDWKAASAPVKKPVSDTDTEKTIDALLSYLVASGHSCPFPDEISIEMEKKCEGFGESRCKDCIREHLELLMAAIK